MALGWRGGMDLAGTVRKDFQGVSIVLINQLISIEHYRQQSS